MFRHGSDTVEIVCAARMFNKRSIGNRLFDELCSNIWRTPWSIGRCFKFLHKIPIRPQNYWFTKNSRELVAKLKNLLRGTFSAPQTALLILFFCPREKLETPLFPRTLNSSSKCVASHSFRNKIFRWHINRGERLVNGKIVFPDLWLIVGVLFAVSCIKYARFAFLFRLSFSPNGYGMEIQIRLIEADVSAMGVDDDLLCGGKLSSARHL